LTHYGFGFYHNSATASIGVWFGFGQLQLYRWGATLCLLSFMTDDSPIHWNRYWLSVGRSS